MAEGIRIPSREEAGDWLSDLSDQIGQAFGQASNKLMRRKQKRTVGTFLKENMWLPVLLGVMVFAGIMVVARTRQTGMMSLPEDTELEEDVSF